MLGQIKHILKGATQSMALEQIDIKPKTRTTANNHDYWRPNIPFDLVPGKEGDSFIIYADHTNGLVVFKLLDIPDITIGSNKA